MQEELDQRPDIPGLTPRGFQRWATLMIQAHPEREYERLQRAVLNMPINNPNDKKERFPKEIPSQLFPELPSLAQRERIEQAIIKHCHVELPPITDEEISKAAAYRPKAPGSPSKAPTESGPAVAERGRQPYLSSSAIIDDEDESTSPHPIERERQPYRVQPGGGKLYDEAGSNVRGHTDSFSRSRPKDIPPRHRPSDAYSQEPPHIRPSRASVRFSKNGRSRSSSRGMNARGDYRHSESDLVDRDSRRYSGLSPTGEYYYDPTKSNLPGDVVEDSRRARDLDLDAENTRFHDTLRDRERERDRSKYQEHLPHRPSWTNSEDYYRGTR